MSDLTFRSIIELWPSRVAMALDIGAPASAVTKWHQRDSIPADWWSAVLASPTALSAGLTSNRLTELAARDRALVNDILEARA